MLEKNALTTFEKIAPGDLFVFEWEVSWLEKVLIPQNIATRNRQMSYLLIFQKKEDGSYEWAPGKLFADLRDTLKRIPPTKGFAHKGAFVYRV